jgi:hypothetical protein
LTEGSKGNEGQNFPGICLETGISSALVPVYFHHYRCSNFAELLSFASFARLQMRILLFSEISPTANAHEYTEINLFLNSRSLAACPP